jgi:Ca2+-binding EF-hand superfamily protein
LKSALGAGALAVLAAGLLPAAAPPRAPSALPALPDHLDGVFLSSEGPVLLRLHVQIGGRPYHAEWQAYLRKLFAQLDRNGDGVLTKAEVDGRVPNGNYLMSHLAGAIGPDPRRQVAPFADLDANKDGKVTPDEFMAYYHRTGFTALRPSFSTNDQLASSVNDTLFKYLDTNRDGKLSKEELAQGPVLLRKLDIDEDEVWTAQELNLTPRPRGEFERAVAAVQRARRAPAARGPGFLEMRPDNHPFLAASVIVHYDRNRDGKLSRDEVKLSREAFDRLDRDGDGLLDAAEVQAFFARPPDLELLARAGDLPGAGGLLSRIGIGGALVPKRAELHNPGKRPMPLAGRVKQVESDALAFALGDADFSVQVGATTYKPFRNVRRFYEEQFRNLDVKDRGFVELAQEKENRGYPFLFYLFPLADRNGDGKLTRRELSAYLDLQEEGSACYVTVQVSDTGRSLFERIDANGDGRLGVREFRTAWERLGPLAKSPQGVAREDVPRRLRVTVSQAGGGGIRPPAPVAPVSMARPGRAVKARPAPEWHRKMDRNGDGDVSLREFLGTEEEFRLLDTDGDGLISVEEALAYEARQKKGAKK